MTLTAISGGTPPGEKLYELLTGRLPFLFPGDSEFKKSKSAVARPLNTVRIILEEPPIPILERNSRIPEKLALVVDKSIRKPKGERFAKAQDFINELKAAFPR